MAKKQQAAIAAESDLLARIEERQLAMSEKQELLHAAMAEKLELIHSETKRTNGRVTRLEDWRSKMYGVWMVIAFAGPAIGAFIMWLIQFYITPK